MVRPSQGEPRLRMDASSIHAQSGCLTAATTTVAQGGCCEQLTQSHGLAGRAGRAFSRYCGQFGLKGGHGADISFQPSKTVP